MSVKSHLRSLASDLYISPSSDEAESIETSISAIERRLDRYFDDKKQNGIQFGSSTRGTMLPRSADPESDIDYMIVFKNGGDYKPQTLMDRLRRFANKYYKRSEIRQSRPTVVLELNHLMFDLVPAYKDLLGTLRIPAPNSNFEEWTSTDPKGFKDTLQRRNKQSGWTLKKVVRLVKYWNARRDYVYTPYELEKKVAKKTYVLCNDIWDYFSSAMGSLNRHSLPDYKSRKVRVAQDRIDTAKTALKNDKPAKAERKVRKVVPKL